MTLKKKYTKAYEILRGSAVDYEGDQPIKHIKNRFESEYAWQIERYGRHKALTEWPQGLALNIPYTYHDIMTTFDLTGKQCQTYFSFMAMRLNELFEEGKD